MNLRIKNSNFIFSRNELNIFFTKTKIKVYSFYMNKNSNFKI